MYGIYVYSVFVPIPPPFPVYLFPFSLFPNMPTVKAFSCCFQTLLQSVSPGHYSDEHCDTTHMDYFLYYYDNNDSGVLFFKPK